VLGNSILLFRKKSGTRVAKNKIQLLVSKIDIASMDKATVLDVFKNSAINDFEDGLQYYSALNAKCNCIVTEDLKDFYFSSLEVLTCRDFLTKYA
jgi:hypothetical protein